MNNDRITLENSMLNHSIKVLLIEDNLAEARLFKEFLKEDKSQQYSLVNTRQLEESLQEINLKCQNYDVILLDLNLPDSQGISSLNRLIEEFPSIPIVILTNLKDEQLAIESVRQGAQDYLVKKEINPHLLIRSLRYAIERKQVLERLRQVNQVLESRVETQTSELIKAEETNYLKSEFFSMLSHDIRNPLNTIQLASQLLQRRDERITMEQKKAHLQIIRSAIKNMSSLLDELSFIGKTDSAKLKCHRTQVNLENLCRQLVEENQLAAGEKNVEIELTTSGNFSQTVWDKNLLRHILGNLLTNAIKYSLPNTKVLFELIRQDRIGIFRLTDRGIGISPTDQQYLFQPFYRGENVGAIPGSGLGMAIVKKCVELYAGEIVVDSQVGVMTTFTVALPITEV